MNMPVIGPDLDDLTTQWIDGDIPAGSYLEQARRLARESARRDITKLDQLRSNGSANGAANGAVHPYEH
jgi:hypothetical protein